LDIEIRSLRDDEYDAFMRAQSRAFGGVWSEEERKGDRPIFEAERSLVAVDGGEMVGGGIACTMRLAVPGGTLPAAGITSVGVSPSHRRRGILRALMRRQLDDVHERGEPLAALWASEGPIYGRFGYGLGSWSGSISVDRGHAAFQTATEASGRIAVLEKERAWPKMRQVYGRVWAGTAGFLGRDDTWWAYRFADPERHRDGAGALLYALYDGATGPEGYVAYRTKPAWPEGSPAGVLTIEELVASSPQAYAALWRLALDHDLIARVEAHRRPVDEPLLLMVADPRRLRFTLHDGLYVRLVDVAAALAGRGYAREGSVVLEVRDAFCPWNEDRFAVEASADGASCEPTRAEPDLILDVSAVGAAYLGGNTFAALVRAGAALEARPGAAAGADDLFRTERAPWCPHLF